jgi:hypothetical protein
MAPMSGRKRRGGRDYGPEEAQRYAERFGVTPEWLLTGHRAEADGSADLPVQPRRPAPTRRSVIGYVGTAAESHFYAVAPEEFDETEGATPATTESTAALEIRGTSLGSQLDRWFVLYDDMSKPPIADLIGELCVVALDDGRILVKRLARGGAEGKFDLIAPGRASHPQRHHRVGVEGEGDHPAVSGGLTATHSSGEKLKVRRAAAVARSSRRVRNSTLPSAMRKSSRWMRPQSQHCSRKFCVRGLVHSP